MLLQNERVYADFSDTNGCLLTLKDKHTGMEFINSLPHEPCRIVLKSERNWNNRPALRGPYTVCGKKATLSLSSEGLEIVWKMDYEITLHAKAALLEDGLAFTSYAECTDSSELHLVEYPVIGGMGDWGNNAEMIHSFATGLKVKRPLVHFKNGEGVRYAPYPECFSGASMQFFAYLTKGMGGLLFTAEDGESHQKWLNLYRNEDGMEATMMYGFEDMGRGKSFYAPYPFTIRFLEGKGWEEAAQKYKDWAIQQPWCSMGTLSQRPHCEWLLKEIGLTTFGIDASQDRSNYIHHYHDDVNTKVFHVLGPDWANKQQSFSKTNPGYSLDGWVPVSFNEENMKAIREVGDRFAPFEFDCFGHAREDEPEEIHQAAEKNRCKFPQHPTYSCDAYNFFMMCPCEEHSHDMHVERDEEIVRESGADGMYYDISANNLLHICLDEHHHHPVGGGNVITHGYQKIYQDTKDACAKSGNVGYFPIGTEMINEVFLPQLDFYQARAGAQPCSALEMWPYKALLDDGRAELIPMFAYVYHEYGAVRMDGWGKCVEEVGDLFYDSVAKIYLWGGLYELNHEYAPGEAFDGVETKVEDHYWEGFTPFGYEYSYGRARYLRKFAALRTGEGNRYLAYGKMKAPPETDISDESRHYYHYNHGVNEIFSGDIKVPSVRISAWQSTEAKPVSYAIMLAYTGINRKNHVRLKLEAKDYPGASKVEMLTGFGGTVERIPLGNLEQGMLDLDLNLPCREPVMIEIR